MEDRELYDIRSASRRVKRSRRTLYYWMRHGLDFQVVGGRRYISHDDLLAMFRVRLVNRREQRASGKSGRFSGSV
jgi:hypothetical protein